MNIFRERSSQEYYFIGWDDGVDDLQPLIKQMKSALLAAQEALDPPILEVDIVIERIKADGI